MSKKTAHFILFLAAFLWGVNFISMKYLTGVFPPFSLIFIRFFIASLFLWAILQSKRKKNPQLLHLEKKDYIAICITGFIGISLYFYFQLFAFKYLTANLAALLCALIPIFSLPAEAIYFKKKCHPLAIILSGISLYGVYMVLNMTPKEALASNALLGIFFMVMSILCWVVYTLITTDLQNKYGSLSAVAFQTIAGTVFLGITALKDIGAAFTTLASSSDALLIIGNLLFIGVGSSALGYLFFIEGMKRIGVQLSSLYMNVIPIITAIASFIVFGERMVGRQLLGMAVVITSIVLINKVDQQNKKPTEVLQPSYKS